MIEPPAPARPVNDAHSIAIETSCRAGGLALGRGGELRKAVAFDAAGRHATQLLQRLDELLREAGLCPGDLGEVYVSAGPGGFTGLRIGITVARTLAQALPALRVVAVPTIQAVAENARDLAWGDLAVVMDYKDGEFYAGLFARRPAGRGGSGPKAQVLRAEEQGPRSPRATRCAPYDLTAPPALTTPQDFLSRAPRPLLVLGEALEFARLDAPDVTIADPALHRPTPEGVWRVGRRLAEAGAFVAPERLLPIYTRKPEAVRLWEKRNP